MQTEPDEDKSPEAAGQSAQDAGGDPSGGKLLIVAAGGTGGHMFPAQALAVEMLRRGWRVALSSDERGLAYAKGFPEEVTRREVKAASFARGGTLDKLRVPFTVLGGVRETMAWFKETRPAVVAGFGGYPSLPALAAARALGVPRLIHEQNGVLGRVNRLFARQVDAVACGVWPLQAAPKGAPLAPVGNPIREEARRLAASAYAPPSNQSPLRLLVFGGSQGARVFARLVPPAVGLLAASFRRRMSIVQQVRPEDHDEVADAYRRMEVAAELSPFFDDMPRRIAAAHLVIARAGASTIAEICAIGRPSLLAPYPHAAHDHQSANAAALTQARAAEIIPDATTTAEMLCTRLGALFAEPQRLEGMADAARRLGKPGASEDLGDLVEKVSRNGAGAKSIRK